MKTPAQSWILVVLISIIVFSCKKKDAPLVTSNPTTGIAQWLRHSGGPIFRDTVLNIPYDYQISSDAHVFMDANSNLQMIYTGDYNGVEAIKLANGSSWTNWNKDTVLLHQPNGSGLDIWKETPFYRLTSSGKHQIYYIGYDDENTYEAQIYLAESDFLRGPYTQIAQPVVPRGIIAGKNVYCITSPSAVEHGDTLYLSFIGWNNSPSNVTDIWIMGATSFDEGHTWSNFQEIDTKIGMEGQITKTPSGKFVAVRTTDYGNTEAIFYASAPHPFGPWIEKSEPILVQNGPPYEKDQIIAAQITFDPTSGKEYLYYTGADQQLGWWIMLATED